MASASQKHVGSDAANRIILYPFLHCSDNNCRTRTIVRNKNNTMLRSHSSDSIVASSHQTEWYPHELGDSYRDCIKDVLYVRLGRDMHTAFLYTVDKYPPRGRAQSMDIQSINHMKRVGKIIVRKSHIVEDNKRTLYWYGITIHVQMHKAGTQICPEHRRRHRSGTCNHKMYSSFILDHSVTRKCIHRLIRATLQHARMIWAVKWTQ